MVGDALAMGFIALCGPLVLIAIITLILRYFVGLKSRPSQRAAWIAGSAYVIVAAILVGFGPAGYAIWSIAATIPGALIAFWFWRREFKRAWVEDPEMLPEGTTLEDDDWRTGLLRLALVLVILIGIALFRMIRNGMVSSL